MDYSIVVARIKPSIAIVFAVRDRKVIGKGSGFVYSKKGLLVTCNHVIREQDVTILLKFPGENRFIEAKIAIRDEEHDLALIKFDDDSREPLKQADGVVVKEGMPIIFAGYPLDLSDLTTHQGILSAIIKDATGIMTYLIDGTVNRGNSGCPLMTREGDVIGVVNAKRREHSNLLTQVEKMQTGAISLHGIDIVNIYHALIDNLQLGIGYAIPASYIPQYHSEAAVKDIESPIDEAL